MGFQPSGLHRDWYLARAANLAWIKLAAAKRSEGGNGLQPAEPPQRKHHLHRCSYPSARETTSFPPEGRRGNHFARLYHAADCNPAARANLARPDPSRRRKPANLLRGEGCQRSQPWQLSQGGEATGFPWRHQADKGSTALPTRRAWPWPRDTRPQQFPGSARDSKGVGTQPRCSWARGSYVCRTRKEKHCFPLTKKKISHFPHIC